MRSAILLIISILYFSAFAFCEAIQIRDWAPYSGVSNISSADNILSFTSTSQMPLILSRNDLFINANRFKVLAVRIKTSKSYATGRIFFRRIGDKDFYNFNYLEFQTGKKDATSTRILDLAKNPNWGGVVTQLMLSPVNEITNVEIESLRLLEPSFGLMVSALWQEFFKYESPVPRTINFMYGAKINNISVNVYMYWAILLLLLPIYAYFFIRKWDNKKIFVSGMFTVLIFCFIAWALIDLRNSMDQIRSAQADWRVFDCKSLEEKQALSTYGTFYDFYQFLKFSNNEIPKGSSFDLKDPGGYIYFINKAKYYLYPTYQSTDNAEYILVYDVGNFNKNGYKMFRSFKDNAYILKRL